MNSRTRWSATAAIACWATAIIAFAYWPTVLTLITVLVVSPIVGGLVALAAVQRDITILDELRVELVDDEPTQRTPQFLIGQRAVVPRRLPVPPGWMVLATHNATGEDILIEYIGLIE